jgi:hypothetical protein
MARLGRSYWQSAVGKFDKSELSQEAFCEAHGLTLGTFRSWLYRLRREGGNSTPKFVEVSVARKSASSQACVVIIGKAELRFESVPDAVYLGAMLRAASGE